jgi:hypothetical protein
LVEILVSLNCNKEIGKEDSCKQLILKDFFFVASFPSLNLNKEISKEKFRKSLNINDVFFVR